MKKWLPWIALVVVVVGALFVGTRGNDTPETAAQRTERLSRGVRCPTCRDLSAAESDAAAAKAIRIAIRRDVDAGRADSEIRARLASRYGRDILLTPDSQGVTGLVWILPVAAVIVGAGALVFTLRRWRPGASSRRTRSWLVAGVLAAVAVIAGVVVANGAGQRLPAQAISGSVEQSSAERLAVARQYIADGKAVDALKTFDEILKSDPKNVEALAYRGWLLRLAGLADEGLVYIDRAIAVDPSYPDARFFKGTILFRDKKDPGGAIPEFRAYLAAAPQDERTAAVQELLKQAEAEAAAKPAA